MVPNNKLLASLLAGAALLSSQASAGIIFSDDFSSLSGGTGWATGSAWNDDIVHSNDTGSVTVSGGSIVVANNGTNNTNTRTHRELASNPLLTVDASTDLWFSANIAYTGVEDMAAWFGISFFENYTGSADGNAPLFFGANTATDFWQILGDGSDTSSINHFTTTTALLVARIQDNQVEMWINPADTSSEVSLGVASASVTGINLVGDTYNMIRIGAGNNNDSGNDISSVTIDSMTLSTTLAEAVVPEPSTFALLAGMFGLSCVMLRRRA